MERGVEEALRCHSAMPVTTAVAYDVRSVFPQCPRRRSTMEREYQSFCDRCGQKLDWRRYGRSRQVIRL